MYMYSIHDILFRCSKILVQFYIRGLGFRDGYADVDIYFNTVHTCTYVARNLQELHFHGSVCALLTLVV